MKRSQIILNTAFLISLQDIKEATAKELTLLILSGHYLSGMAAKELSGRLCSN
jgi:hypothetical protein